MGVRVVLLGDSHLARVGRDAEVLGEDVVNLAVEGAELHHVTGQLALLPQGPCRVLLSIGTNDAADPSMAEGFRGDLTEVLQRTGPVRVAFLAPPGLLPARLPVDSPWRPETVDAVREAAVAACGELGVPVVRADHVIEPLGPMAFAPDGVHLSGPGYAAVLPEARRVLDGVTPA